jgi:hypothetical protein
MVFDSYIWHNFLKPRSKLGYSIGFQNIAVTEYKNTFCTFVFLCTQLASEIFVLYKMLIRSEQYVAQYIASEYIASYRNILLPTEMIQSLHTKCKANGRTKSKEMRLEHMK